MVLIVLLWTRIQKTINHIIIKTNYSKLKSGNKNQQRQRKSVLSVDKQDKDKADVQGYQAMATGDNKCTCDGIDDPCSELNKMNSQLFGTDKGRDQYKTDWMVDAIKRGTVSVATQFNRLAFLQHKKKSDPYQAEPLFPVESAEQHLAMKENLSCCCDVFTKTLLVKGVGNTMANPNQQFDNGLGVGRVNTSLADMAAQTILHMNNLQDAKTSFKTRQLTRLSLSAETNPTKSTIKLNRLSEVCRERR